MMWIRSLSRAFVLAPLGLGLFAGVLLVAGCGEKEARIISANKSKDELQKDIENPYGVHLKVPVKGKRGRG